MNTPTLYLKRLKTTLSLDGYLYFVNLGESPLVISRHLNLSPNQRVCLEDMQILTKAHGWALEVTNVEAH